MANPPKQKGTRGETELQRLLDEYGIEVTRTSPGASWDLERPAEDGYESLDALAIRPDRGRWLVTVDLDTFAYLVDLADDFSRAKLGLRIEVKRYARSSLHTTYEKKFGGAR